VVTFQDVATTLETVPVSGGLIAKAQLTTSSLSPGTHHVSATYLTKVSLDRNSTSKTVTEIINPPSPPPPTGVTDVSALVSVTPVQPRHHHQANQLREHVILLNHSGQAITGPLFLVLDGLPRGVQWRNATGTTQTEVRAGDPFEAIDVSQLGPGQSIPLTLLFSDSRHKPIHFTPHVLAGQGLIAHRIIRVVPE
jgi:hypothetical protein